jgi:hypothetical protein
MKKYLLIISLITLTSCSIGGGVADVSTEQRSTPQVAASGTSDPYAIGSVDTAFRLIGPDHKIEI